MFCSEYLKKIIRIIGYYYLLFHIHLISLKEFVAELLFLNKNLNVNCNIL